MLKYINNKLPRGIVSINVGLATVKNDALLNESNKFSSKKTIVER